MQNASMAGVPMNCINWLALGAVVYGAMEKKKALRVLGLKEQYKTIDVIKYDEVMALVNKGVSYKEIAEGLGVSLTSFKNRCKTRGQTMNHVTTLFNSNEFGELRTIIIENKVYFVAKSVATALGYKDTADAIRKHIDEEDKLRWQIADTGQKRETYLINESGLYSLILKSKMPSAKKFKRWVTSEVLPQIRKTGSYDLRIPKSLPEALRLYADEVEAHNQSKAIIEQQKQQIAEYEPKVDYVDKILSSTNAVTVTQIAADYGLSAKTLNKILHDAHIQRSVNGQWILYSDLMHKGYTKTKTHTYMTTDGRLECKASTRWTQKGRLMIHELLKKLGINAVCEEVA